jgi:membrane protein
MRVAVPRPVRWLIRFVERLTEHQAGDQATIIAFNIIYAMFPLALSLTSIGGFIVHQPAARSQLVNAVHAAFPEQLAQEMADVINTAGTYPGIIGAIGFVSLLWAGSNLFTAMEISFSRIFGVAPRGIVHQRLMSFLIILAFSVLLVLSVAAAHVAVLVRQTSGTALVQLGTWGGTRFVGLLGGWVFSMLGMWMIYLVVPNVRLPFRALWPGAVLAGTFLQITSLAFPLYIRYVAGVSRFGDAFSLVFLMMTWAYFLGFILLAGAELNALCCDGPPPAMSLPSEP